MAQQQEARFDPDLDADRTAFSLVLLKTLSPYFVSPSDVCVSEVEV